MSQDMKRVIATDLSRDQDLTLAEVLRIVGEFEAMDVLRSFGSACFFITSLLERGLSHRGVAARQQDCRLRIYAPGDRTYLIGYPGHARPGQADAHAVCLV